jgi:uncharacterized protein (DUF433 family)
MGENSHRNPPSASTATFLGALHPHRKEKMLAPHKVCVYGPIMNGQDRITFNPMQCGGRPCIRGMRIRVKDVLDLLATGMTETEILKDYPYLEVADIRACLEYAAAQTDHAVLTAA